MEGQHEIQVVVADCVQCGHHIYLHNTYWKTKLGRVHEDCMSDLVEAELDAVLTEGFEGLLD
jgi:hypothetical protein